MSFTTRPELRGTFGAVAATHWIGAQVGMRILERGGNAFDAAVAVGFALQVVEPHLNGPGGEVPILANRAGEDAPRVICGQGPAPRAATIARFAALGLETIPGTGHLAACVPGAFGAWLTLLRDWGTLRLADVLEPAIFHAGGGHPLVWRVPQTIASVKTLFELHWRGSAALYLPGGAVPETGALFRNRPLATLYAAILADAARVAGREAQIARALDYWYRGPVAAAIDRFARIPAMDASGEAHAGLLTGDDLARWTPPIEAPVALDLGAHRVFKCGAWTQGPALLQLLQLLEPFDLEVSGAGSALTAHRLAEAMNLVFRDRNQWLGDPRSLATPIPDLLDPAYLDRLRRSLDPGRHRPAASLAAPPPPRRESVNTTHLSVADREGGLVALTTTLNFAYGNGISVPGAGFLLNNEMDDFSAAPGRPNPFGLVQGEANAIAPGRRPLSSMAPTLVFRPDGTPWLATGSPGGSRILSTVAQVLLQRIVWGANLATAVAAPRLHSQLWPDQLALEEGFSPDTRRLLEAMGHTISTSPAMGAANSVEVLRPPGTGSLGAADPRRGIGGAVAEPR